MMQEQNIDSLNELESEEIDEIMTNLRIDTEAGTMSPLEIMADIVKGRQEINQYERASLSMKASIDERLREEEENNPDSKEAEVLKELKEASQALFDRTKEC